MQKLRDENNLLKGEQAKPNIAANKKKKNEDHSSEKERKEEKPSKEPKSKAKNHKIKIDRTEYCKVDKKDLPEDAEFKGYQSYIPQEILIKTDNVEYKREVYYSASQKKTYTGKLPPEIKGGYGPGIKTFTYTLKHISNVSEPKVEKFFKNVGIYISQSTISRILTKDPSVKVFNQEKADIFKAGICSTRYQQIDDTSARGMLSGCRGMSWFIFIFLVFFFLARREDLLPLSPSLWLSLSRLDGLIFGLGFCPFNLAISSFKFWFSSLNSCTTSNN